MDVIGSLVVRMVPVAIPIILVWSFLINHGLAPTGGSGEKKQKPDSKEGSKETKDSKDSKDTKGPED